MNKSLYLFVLLPGLLCSCGGQRWTESVEDGYHLITQKGGATLGYSPKSGISIIQQDGYAFKDLNRNGKLDVYEDWRQSVDVRVADLTAQLSMEDIAGLMLYSSHQTIPVNRNVYNGKTYTESGVPAWELTDEQKVFLEKDGVRHVLITAVRVRKRLPVGTMRHKVMWKVWDSAFRATTLPTPATHRGQMRNSTPAEVAKFPCGRAVWACAPLSHLKS